MKVLLYLLVPVLAVTVYALYVWARNRQPSSLESGVDAFRREMQALSPESAPRYRRPPEPGTGGGSGPGRAPRPDGPPGDGPARPPREER